MVETSRAVGLISGGLDSTVVAAYMEQNYDKSYYVFANYGQKTLERERKAFDALCGHFGPEQAEELDLTWLRKVGRSALFEEDTFLNVDNRRSEYVPFRNANLLGAAVALAETVDAGTVLIGSTGGDRTCPDNSPAFLAAYQRAIAEGTMTEEEIRVAAPLITLDKKGVIELGLSLGAPFELSWSCHNNSGHVACGECSNCSSRRDAFIELDRKDPIEYADRPS
jgi:7-cyano-7-deazaguanine synthase